MLTKVIFCWACLCLIPDKNILLWAIGNGTFCNLCFQVLQKQMDLELELFGDLKEKAGSTALGKVYMLSLSSQPVDHEDASGERTKVGKV